MIQLIILNGLWKSHQRGHLSVEDVNGPPNLSTPLDNVFPQLCGWHVGVHSLSESYAHRLADLSC